jgi:hypothetical protein
MKAFLFALVGALVVAGLGGWLLSMGQTDTSARFTTESVRLGDPGHNLLVNANRDSQEHRDKRAARD